MRRFDGRVALVTGAARGIGRAIAARLVDEGAAVALADLDADAVVASASELAAAGGEALPMVCDVTDRVAVAATVAAVVARHGRLDVLVNNVGVSAATPFEDIDEAAWQDQVGPTLHGAVSCIQAALPHLLASPAGGCVVSIGSVNGLAAFGDVVYSSAKAGLVSLNQNLATLYSRRELQRQGSSSRGVRFNLVAPGTVRTAAWTRSGPDGLATLDRLAGRYPAGRVGEPEDIAAAVAFLASDDASWITGVVLPVDGGALTGPLSLGNWAE
ncbi:oxidoreductase [Asanoa ishikariensis]|uniref:NAD(P)-dependent dehydrogenase, short-chain alcohol dehydrogenase family n=1 Tax=Asanoa ishikariensis TaxID=137265 RepID=A0A1H3PAK2_9ACTN|nr:SDR family NAD(P)-dependent oxidoreductase [Asanoa ishikariensis]GIF67994.1 oxidoreductase [Asanoa ishikariensis]SDY97855.1 NAD(P)-dependent dehydrogenase, short-chain alcohol dehydrogenase family [Asanoa ishikariensis]